MEGFFGEGCERGLLQGGDTESGGDAQSVTGAHHNAVPEGRKAKT
jgi:hypothetical protein